MEPEEDELLGEVVQDLLADDVHHAEETGHLRVGARPAGSVPEGGVVPHSHRPVHTGGHEHVPRGVESEAGHPVLVPRDGGHQAPVQPVPDLDSAVVTGAQYPGVELVPGKVPHVVRVSSQPPSLLVGGLNALGVPEDDVGVVAPAGQERVLRLRVTGDTPHRPRVVTELSHQAGAGAGAEVVVTSDLTIGQTAEHEAPG